MPRLHDTTAEALRAQAEEELRAAQASGDYHRIKEAENNLVTSRPPRAEDGWPQPKTPRPVITDPSRR